jgi:hypothetical protein
MPNNFTVCPPGASHVQETAVSETAQCVTIAASTSTDQKFPSNRIEICQ